MNTLKKFIFTLSAIGLASPFWSINYNAAHDLLNWIGGLNNGQLLTAACLYSVVITCGITWAIYDYLTK